MIKQVLAKATQDHLFFLPERYETLKQIIAERTGISSCHLLMYHKGKRFTESDFYGLDEDLAIIEIASELCGGFASFGKILWEVFGIGFWLTAQFLVLAGFYGMAIINKSTKCGHVMDALFSVPTAGKDWYPSWFYISIATYTIVSVVTITTILNKAAQCNINFNQGNLIAASIVPPFVALAFLWFIPRSTAKCGAMGVVTTEYLIMMIPFVIGVLWQSYVLTNTLSEHKLFQETEKHETAPLGAILIIFVGVFLLLRGVLYWTDDQNSGITGLLIYCLCMLIAYITIIPDFVHLLVSSVSSKDSLCPQKTN